MYPGDREYQDGHAFLPTPDALVGRIGMPHVGQPLIEGHRPQLQAHAHQGDMVLVAPVEDLYVELAFQVSRFAIARAKGVRRRALQVGVDLCGVIEQRTELSAATEGAPHLPHPLRRGRRSALLRLHEVNGAH
eukprot:CAMPEP_0178384824 /NCGR_PEP_ID=MMETSP0689_2-20121128/7715_1 /TAXON_ID=160604 /ORGANISM="Amphidinium massartii, Strain CS-259" /LENGTH=132 /DNA_ID=CAMNT_0020005085 /DNA_START=535 /DNA_END=935 /DNA_ORIENTATION=-